MKWTYDKIRRYAECQRRRARRAGCDACGKMVPNLELAGTPPLSRMTRDGYGIERVKTAIRSRGWFCRGCVRDITRKYGDSELRGWEKKKKQQQQQCPEPTNKRGWSDDKKWEYCFERPFLEVQDARVHEVFEGAELEAAVKILYQTT